jgi:HEAT repeat protein
MAELAPVANEPAVADLYAVWHPDGTGPASLFRSTDEGSTWLPLTLPAGFVPTTWADDGGRRVAVTTENGSLLRSEDRGDNWSVSAEGLAIGALVWGDDGRLYIGTDGQGVYRLASDGTLVNLAVAQQELASARIVGLSQAEGRLFAVTPTVVFHTDDEVAWTKTTPVPGQVTAVAATDKETVYAGTATVGIYKSINAGRTWRPAGEGLGMAAGQMVRVTALRADPQEAGLVYVAVDHVVGGTNVHASAAGTFVTLDGGALWQHLAGPSFPEARHTSNLVLTPGKPLHAQAVTAVGLQGYAPDVMRLLAALESKDAQTRAAAARQLGLARSLGVWNELLAMLDDVDPGVRLAAADALGRIADPAAVPGLLLAIEHPHEQVRLGAVRALGMMRVEVAVEPLRAMFLQGEGLEVSVSGEALGRIGGPAATDALLTALADAEPSARWHVAIAALEQMGEPAVDPLAQMLESSDAHARRYAAQALGWVGSPAATEALVRALERDRDATVRGQAAWALGEIGDPAAGKPLEQAAAGDTEAVVQTEATRALTRVPEQQAKVRSWAASWAPALSRLQPVRWLILALSLAGAAWLMLGDRPLVAAAQRVRFRHR